MSRAELRRRQARLIILFMISFLLPVSIPIAKPVDEKYTKPDSIAKRPVTVADAIRMTKLGEQADDAAHFSPNGGYFIVVLKKGNLERNTNEYSLLLWKTGEIIHSPTPEVLFTMSSSSNREAIKDLTWMPDNETIAFLGENPGEKRQIYTFNIRTHALKRLTDSVNSILYYSMASGGNEVAYVSEGPVEGLLDEKARREGVFVSTQRLDGLIAGEKGRDDFGNDRLFVSDAMGSREIRVPAKISNWGVCALSPNGRYIVVRTHAETIPENWKEYSDPLLQEFTQKALGQGQVSWITKYLLIDSHTGQSSSLLDSPVTSVESSVAWSPDGQSVALGGVYLPLDNVDSNERITRRSKRFVAEVKVPGGEIVKISPEDQFTGALSENYTRSISWDAETNRLTYQVRDHSAEPMHVKVFFRKRGENWEKVNVPETVPTIVVKEDMNTPPKIYGIDVGTNQTTLLLDLNPTFQTLKLGLVQEIQWKGSDGHDVKGGLYYPVDYVKGKRYPLVIQTHGWEPGHFWIDGPYTTAFAAQPLAGKDIMVLQANEIWGGPDFDTPLEIQREVSTFEGAIDDLDRKALIDRNRVGIVGFSRTGTFVAFALTHSKYRFAAASVADGSDFGDFEFMVFANTSPDAAETVEKFYGALPFGEGLTKWIALSPHFSLDNVQTPLRLLATTPEMLLGQWGWFTSLVALNKPVEMTYLPHGVHVLQKPWDRMISQQGNVDWFAFWLKGEEDQDPAKAEQYTRWRKLQGLVKLSLSK